MSCWLSFCPWLNRGGFSDNDVQPIRSSKAEPSKPATLPLSIPFPRHDQENPNKNTLQGRVFSTHSHSDSPNSAHQGSRSPAAPIIQITVEALPLTKASANLSTAFPPGVPAVAPLEIPLKQQKAITVLGSQDEKPTPSVINADGRGSMTPSSNLSRRSSRERSMSLALPMHGGTFSASASIDCDDEPADVSTPHSDQTPMHQTPMHTPAHASPPVPVSINPSTNPHLQHEDTPRILFTVRPARLARSHRHGQTLVTLNLNFDPRPASVSPISPKEPLKTPKTGQALSSLREAITADKLAQIVQKREVKSAVTRCLAVCAKVIAECGSAVAEMHGLKVDPLCSLLESISEKLEEFEKVRKELQGIPTKKAEKKEQLEDLRRRIADIAQGEKDKVEVLQEEVGQLLTIHFDPMQQSLLENHRNQVQNKLSPRKRDSNDKNSPNCLIYLPNIVDRNGMTKNLKALDDRIHRSEADNHLREAFQQRGRSISQPALKFGASVDLLNKKMNGEIHTNLIRIQRDLKRISSLFDEFFWRLPGEMQKIQIFVDTRHEVMKEVAACATALRQAKNSFLY